jgi:hypothetical protein
VIYKQFRGCKNEYIDCKEISQPVEIQLKWQKASDHIRYTSWIVELAFVWQERFLWTKMMIWCWTIKSNWDWILHSSWDLNVSWLSKLEDVRQKKQQKTDLLFIFRRKKFSKQFWYWFQFAVMKTRLLGNLMTFYSEHSDLDCLRKRLLGNTGRLST